MAVTVRRSGFTLWVAWIAAAALGTVVASSGPWTWTLMTPGGPGDSPAGYFTTALMVAPWLLLQYLVLRLFGVMSARGAGLWVAASFAAAVVYVFAYQLWFEQVMLRSQQTIESMDLMFTIGNYFFPAVFGVSQGVVLARALHRTRLGYVWIAANLGAWFVALVATGPVLGALRFPALVAYPGLGLVLLMTIYAAMTGLVLAAIVKVRVPAPPQQLPRPAI